MTARSLCIKSGKIRHLNARDAQTHALDLLLIKGLDARFYWCRTCKAFHVTTKKKITDRASSQVINSKLRA